MRPIIRGFLESHGMHVLEASNGVEAFRIAALHPGVIDLLLTDIEMPGMSGIHLAGRIVRVRPAVRVLYMSAGVGPQRNDTSNKVTDASFIQKPFRMHELKMCLDRIFAK